MALAITKDCFQTPTLCANCERKGNVHFKKVSHPKEGYKRCANCHLFTYCDKDCQREHWLKVHKNHCKFLSGKVLVENSQHNTATCAHCINERQASLFQIKSENSNKTVCIIEDVANEIRKMIGKVFGFHGDGKKCDCSEEFAINLPFPLGELSGQYLDIGSNGLDAMLAHSLKILNAMFVKARQVEHENVLHRVNSDILKERSFHWIDILTHGKPLGARRRKKLSDHFDSLQTIYGASNPWLKALKFSVEFVEVTHRNLVSTMEDSRSLEGPRFQHVKQIHDYKQSQLRNQRIVCEKQMWPSFMFWPQLVNGSLVTILPPGTRCQSCSAQLFGEVAYSSDEANWKAKSCLLPDVSDNGTIMAACPVAKNPTCVEKCQSKNVQLQMQQCEDHWKEFIKENKLFVIESRFCDTCSKSSLSSHRCSACLTVQYCSTVCQKKDLDFHKTVCSTWAKDESRKIIDKGKQKDQKKSAIDKK